LPLVEAVLRARILTSMFPLSNVMRHGMDGDHDRSMSFWIAEGPDGPKGAPDVIGKTKEGIVMPSCVGAPWVEAASALAGVEVIGVIGAKAQARPLIQALRLDGVATDLNDDDPQFTLDLEDLLVPEGPDHLVQLGDVDQALLIDWRRAFLMEAMSMERERAETQAETDVERYTAADTHRVLIEPDGPRALTGFNAEVDKIVQIGGVYTPPDRRGHGYARRALALHLAEAREHGVRHATLFASGEPAVRAYRAIGFKWVGEWTLFLTSGKEIIGG